MSPPPVPSLEQTMADLFISSQYCSADKGKQESHSSDHHCSSSSIDISIIDDNNGSDDHELFFRPRRQSFTSAGGGTAAGSSSFSTASSSEERTLAALKTHCQAERRRRERINAHLFTLRRFIPNSAKMDKASLLGRVVEEMKDLKRKASSISKTVSTNIPIETNEVNVELYDYNPDRGYGSNLFIKVSVCCEDRPDLYANLIEAFNLLRLQAERAEMVSLGGRVKNVFMLRNAFDDDCEKVWLSLSSLKDSIKEALERIAFSDISSTNFTSRRRRALQSILTIREAKHNGDEGKAPGCH